MADAGLVLRDATPADAAALGTLVVRTWRHGFGELLAPDVLDDLDEDERAAAWARLLADGAGVATASPGRGRHDEVAAWSIPVHAEHESTRTPAEPATAPPTAPGNRVVLVAALGGEVVGVAVGETWPPAAGVRSDGAVRALCVAPHAQGAGVGRALLRGLVAALRADDARVLELRVLAGAWWARALYAAEGWRHDEDAEEPALAGAPVERWVLDP